MREKEVCLPLYPLADNQPEACNIRPRIHQLSEKQVCNFWKRVDQSVECWNWTGGHNGSGRAIIKLYGIQMVAPRVAYALHHEIDPGDWDVLHTCDNPSCVNPAHLFLGTPKDNAKDMLNKGRFIASRGNTKIKPGSPEEKILLDTSIPTTVAAKMLGVGRRAVWQRRRQAGVGHTTQGRVTGISPAVV